MARFLKQPFRSAPPSIRNSMDQAKHIQVTIGMLYATAVLAAYRRTAIRLCLQRRLLIDDGFLIVACVALTVSTIDVYKGLLYILEAQEFADARV